MYDVYEDRKLVIYKVMYDVYQDKKQVLCKVMYDVYEDRKQVICKVSNVWCIWGQKASPLQSEWCMMYMRTESKSFAK